MFFSDQIIVDYLFCCYPPPSLQVTTVWCSHFSRTVSPSCPYGDLHPPVRYPIWGGGRGGGGTTHQLIWLVLLPFSNKEGSFFGLHSLKIAIAGNIAGIYFGGACFQAFTQDRTGFVLHTVRYFCETSFSPYGFHLYTNISSIPQSFGIQYRTVLLQNLDSARTGFICTQLPYGTTLHFHVQGEGVSLPLARSHAFSLGHRCSHVLPQSHHFQTVSTMSTSCMSTFECPKVIPYGLDLSLVPCRFLLHRTGFLSVIPYGLSVRTCGSHLASDIPYGIHLQPYGIISPFFPF